jgi:uncharacterized membrane protein
VGSSDMALQNEVAESAPAHEAAAVAAVPGRGRIREIDVVRGIVIVLMVLDHVRDYVYQGSHEFNPLDPDRTTVLLYVTRWVTNFCAPTFVFLAGTSVWLQIAAGKSRGELSTFLVKRGLWLVLLEVTVVSFAWSFQIHYTVIWQVIWAIGWSFVVLAGLVWLPRGAVLALGVVIVAGHDLVDSLSLGGPFAEVWGALANMRMALHVGAITILNGYPVLPWLGVMALGYGLGPVFLNPPAKQARILLALGAGMTVLFVILRAGNFYGDPRLWVERADPIRTAMDFFNVDKYPPSLLFVCITVGPMLASLPLIARCRGMLIDVCRTLGSVPLFAYVTHLYVVHLCGIVLNLAVGNDIDGQFDYLAKMAVSPSQLQGLGLPLPFVYVTWIFVVGVVYMASRWFAELRRRRTEWWLSYL